MNILLCNQNINLTMITWNKDWQNHCQHIMNYVKMILSDMTEEELYPGWNDSVYMFSRNDSIEMDWDGRRNPNDEII